MIITWNHLHIAVVIHKHTSTRLPVPGSFPTYAEGNPTASEAQLFQQSPTASEAKSSNVQYNFREFSQPTPKAFQQQAKRSYSNTIQH
jgi:hypothetical protein